MSWPTSRLGLVGLLAAVACGDEATVGAPPSQTYVEPRYVIQSLIFGDEGSFRRSVSTR